MIPLGASFLLMAVLLSGGPPSKPCDLFRHGKFDEGVDEKQAAISGKKNGLRIIRQGVSQWNHYRETGLKLRYRVLWRDDCTFLLFDRRVKAGKADREWAPTDTITVRITDTWQENYQYEQSSNFSDRITSGTVHMLVPQGYGVTIGL